MKNTSIFYLLFSTYYLFYNDPRLKMNIAERYFVSLVIWIFYVLLSIAAIIFLLDWDWHSPPVYMGIFSTLFLMDRARFLFRAEKSIPHLFLKKASVKELENLNAEDYFTSKAKNYILQNFCSSQNQSDFYVNLLFSLVKTNIIKGSLARLDVNIKDFQKEIELAKKQKNIGANPLSFSEAESFCLECFKEASMAGYNYADLPQLFIGLFDINVPEIQKIFSHFNLIKEDFKNSLILAEFQSKVKPFFKAPTTIAGFARRPKKIKHRIMNRAWTARPTPFLDQFSEDLTDLARVKQIGLLVGHEQEYDRMIDILTRSIKNNVMLIGPEGIGKETMIDRLAFDIVNDRVPPKLFDKRLIKLSLGELAAGAGAAGELQGRMDRIIKEFFAAGNVCFYIPDIHNLTTVAGPYLSIASVIKPFLERSDFQVIGSADETNFKKYLEPQKDFLESFETILIEEISEENAKRVLIFESILLERQYKIKISYAAIKAAVELAHRYIASKFLPSSASNLLKETISFVVQKEEKLVSADDVIEAMQRQTNVPIKKIGVAEAESLLNLENLIHEKLIDQSEAVTAVARVLREYRAGITRKGGPIAAFLFVGPTGVGKTELAKIIAKVQFGSEEAIVRFDMSGYQDETSIFRFIGSPDAKVSGALSDAVRAKPYCLVLLDEFEKASKDILNLFLPIFDEGKITDNLGNKINFTHSLIICTSNAHSEFILTELTKGKTIDEVSDEVKKALIRYFPPELINRFNDIIVFKALGLEDTYEICALQLKEIAKMLEKNKSIFISFDEIAVRELSRLGYSPIFGARPLRNVIQKEIRSLLAEEIIKRDYPKGTKLKIIYEDTKFIVQEDK